MLYLLNGDFTHVQSFVGSTIAYLRQDAPPVSAHASFVQHVSQRTLHILSDLCTAAPDVQVKHVDHHAATPVRDATARAFVLGASLAASHESRMMGIGAILCAISTKFAVALIAIVFVVYQVTPWHIALLMLGYVACGTSWLLDIVLGRICVRSFMND